MKRAPCRKLGDQVRGWSEPQQLCVDKADKGAHVKPLAFAATQGTRCAIGFRKDPSATCFPASVNVNKIKTPSYPVLV